MSPAWEGECHGKVFLFFVGFFFFGGVIGVTQDSEAMLANMQNTSRSL